MNQPSDRKRNHWDTQVSEDIDYQSRAWGTTKASILSNASNVSVKDSSFSITANINTVTKPTLDVLYQRVAPNAILNEGGRVDDAKCHPGTREEVISLIEGWMDTAESSRILWLSGPAGGGKTAIMKTIIERSTDRGARTVNFFVFRGDPTRNTARAIIPTVLYQLLELYPSAVEEIVNILYTRPLLLEGSVAQQCKLISTFFPIVRQSSPAGAKITVLIDGLDECDVDSRHSQGDILRVLAGFVMEDDSPFRLLVASRPEAHIHMAFNQLPSETQTIFLNEEYSPKRDIRRFVTAEFNRIKASHPSARALPGEWPPSLDVEEIVMKSSGQFIYAATVMRYISHASTVPSLSLERVKGIAPAINKSPFAELDSVYVFILSRATDPDTRRDILSMKHLAKFEMLCHYDSRYNQALIGSCISELSSIVRLNERGILEFYHASLADFLLDQTRSGAYWIDVDAFRAKVLTVLWEKPAIIRSRDNLQAALFRDLVQPTSAITRHLLNMESVPDWMMTGRDRDIEYYIFRQSFVNIERLYYQDDDRTYKRILRRFIYRLVCCNNILLPDVDGIPYAAQYVSRYKRWSWWFRLLNNSRRKR